MQVACQDKVFSLRYFGVSFTNPRVTSASEKTNKISRLFGPLCIITVNKFEAAPSWIPTMILKNNLKSLINFETLNVCHYLVNRLIGGDEPWLDTEFWKLGKNLMKVLNDFIWNYS